MIARTLGFMDRKNHRDVISRSNSLNCIGDILHTFAKILASRLVIPMIRLPANRCLRSAKPEASEGSCLILLVTHLRASITVLPVTWTVAGSTFS